MRKIAICLGAILVFSNLWSKDLKLEDVRKVLMDRIQLESSMYKGKKVFFTLVIKKKKSDDILEQECNGFLAGNYFWVTYLKDQILEEDFFKPRREGNPTKDSMEESFKDFKQSNVKLFQPVFELFLRYLYSKGYKIEGFSPGEIKEYTMDEILPIAVRFVYPSEILKDGRIRLHICAFINALKDYRERNLLLEGFVFQVIMGRQRGEKGNVLGNLKRYVDLVRSLKFSPGNERELYRAQGALWMLLLRDKYFRDAFVRAYEKRKLYMPFRLKY